MTSLRRRLLLWLLPATFIAGALASVGSYWGAWDELNDQLNDHSRYIAEHVNVTPDGQVTFDNGPLSSQLADEDALDEILLQVWDARGQLQYSTNPKLALPAPNRSGMVDERYQGQTWHTFVSQRGDRFIRVAQAQNSRWEALAGMSVHLFWPVLSLLPVLGFVLWFGVGSGLKPLQQIAAQLRQRGTAKLTPVTVEKLPSEVKPLVSELNDMLVRLDQGFTEQKHFIADAAHELRTPIMALSIQAELAQRASNEDERTLALSKVQESVAQLSHLANQLLTMARLEPDAIQRNHQPVELRALCKAAIKSHLSQAVSKEIDLGLVGQQAVSVAGDPENLSTMLSNLVDNAIRHSPAGSRIDLSVAIQGQFAVLEVVDNGPGIPFGERQKVLERFYRGSQQNAPGSGLGLSIVKRVVDQHGAEIFLGEGAGGIGLSVRVKFPLVSNSVPTTAASAPPTQTGA